MLHYTALSRWHTNSMRATTVITKRTRMTSMRILVPNSPHLTQSSDPKTPLLIIIKSLNRPSDRRTPATRKATHHGSTNSSNHSRSNRMKTSQTISRSTTFSSCSNKPSSNSENTMKCRDPRAMSRTIRTKYSVWRSRIVSRLVRWLSLRLS